MRPQGKWKEMTEYTLTDGELGGIAEQLAERAPRGALEAGAGRRPWAGHALRLLATVLLVGWSAKWLPPLFAEIGTQTAIGQRGLTQLPSGYEVFELLFVAGHLGVRWLPGVAVALGLFWISARLRRRARAR
jgi:ferric-dicitrate binding protein FerR (iron transport regulator)